jgi:hypothetical protein
MRVKASILALALSALPALAGGQLTNIPSDLQNDQKEFWRIYMREYGGAYNKEKKCWEAKIKGADYCLRPHTFALVTEKGARRIYLSVSAPGTDQCHGCMGFIEFMVLDVGAERMRIAARSERVIESGSYGAPPAEDGISVRQITSDDGYGFLVDHGWTGQGITLVRTEVLGVIGDQVRSIGTLPKLYDDSGNCEGGKNFGSGRPCSTYEYAITFDTQAKGRFAPVIFQPTGFYEGQTIGGNYVAKFDETKFKYILPKSLPESAEQ